MEGEEGGEASAQHEKPAQDTTNGGGKGDEVGDTQDAGDEEDEAVAPHVHEERTYSEQGDEEEPQAAGTGGGEKEERAAGEAAPTQTQLNAPQTKHSLALKEGSVLSMEYLETIEKDATFAAQNLARLMSSLMVNMHHVYTPFSHPPPGL